MVLIADDDRDIVRFVEVNLRLEGFEVITAHDGQDALDKALDLAEPHPAGRDAADGRLQGLHQAAGRRPQRPHPGDHAHRQVALGRQGARPSPPGPATTSSSPSTPWSWWPTVKGGDPAPGQRDAVAVALTGLPGNLRIEQEIAHGWSRARRSPRSPTPTWTTSKSYNDRYGFLRGDEVISLFAQVLRQAAQDAAGPEGFVGHIGGDDFVALVPRRRPRPSPAGSSAASTTASRPCTTPRTPAPARSSWRTARASSAASQSSRSPWASPPAPSEPSPTTASWSPPPPSSSTWPSAARAPATPRTAAPTGSRGVRGAHGRSGSPPGTRPLWVYAAGDVARTSPGRGGTPHRR